REEQKFFPIITRQNKFDRLLEDIFSISNWTKTFTVIASEGKQSQPWRGDCFISLRSIGNDIV
ncbi:hypothetical protein QHH03_13245, partial [Aphanizomenon sp. 202]|nr:hypothetical protein [Aphanizomenon sp. 202]